MRQELSTRDKLADSRLDCRSEGGQHLDKTKYCLDHIQQDDGFSHLSDDSVSVEAI